MGKFYGEIGFTKTVETVPGVWIDQLTVRNYYGDIIKNVLKNREGEYLNDNVDLENRFSILADNYAYENIGYMRYVVWMGTKWKINGIEVKRPRLILTVGGIYNGKKINVT